MGGELEVSAERTGSEAPCNSEPSTILCSLAMIALVRTPAEDAAMRKAIESVRAVIDEVVLVLDDRSIAVEPPPGAVVVRQRFESFSDQRNAAHALCRGRWHLILDADDWFASLGDLRERMAKARPDTVAIDCVEVSIDGNGKEIDNGTTKVIYRRDVRWKYRGHNQPRFNGEPVNPAKVERSTAVMVYTHRAEDSKARAERTIPMLMLDLAENPGDPHAPFFLARMSWLVGDLAGMQKWARECGRLVPEAVNYSPCWVMDAMATLDLDGLDAAEAVVDRGLLAHPTRVVNGGMVGMPDLLDLKAFIAKAKWMKAIQNRANPYNSTHLSSPRTLKNFLLSAPFLGWPIRKESA